MPACARPGKRKGPEVVDTEEDANSVVTYGAKRAPACSPRRERPCTRPTLAIYTPGGCPHVGSPPFTVRNLSTRTLDHARLAAIPTRHPELRDDADLAPGRADKVHPKAEDGLINGGVGPRGGVLVLGFEHAARVETAVVDAVPAQLVDRG
jgi:hypothetical protein